MISPLFKSGSYSNGPLTSTWSSTRAETDKIVCSETMVVQSSSGCHSARLLLRCVHHGTRNLSLPSSLARTSPTWTFLTKICCNDHTHGFGASGVIADLIRKGDSNSVLRVWLGHFLDRQCTLIKSLDPVQRDTVVDPLGNKLVGLVAQDWIRPAFTFVSNHFMPSRSIMLQALEYRCRRHVPHRRM